MRAADIGLATLVLVLSGCSLAPPYGPPSIAAPPAFREGGAASPNAASAAGPHAASAAGWTTATPGDSAPRGAWWLAFDDPVLTDLEGRVEGASPTLAAALARYDAARANARVSESARFPTIDASAGAARQRAPGLRPLSNGSAQTYDTLTLGATLDYEIDLWGRVRNSVRAGRADAAASAADLAAVRLSLQANLADAYVQLRGLDAEAALLRQTVAAFTRARDLTQTRHDGGIGSGLDVSRADTVLASARAQVSEVANARAAIEHAIAAIVGEVATSFRIAPQVLPLQPPTVAAGIPSELLQRRPDVAEAERRMFAANARIGVARAAQYPQLSLGLGAGLEASGGPLFSTPATYWALGPAQALLNLFDGGRRRAQVRISRAQYDEAAADYRGTVLTAFREVEDGLAAARNQATQAGDQTAAAVAAGRTSELALIRYRDGASDYLEVVTAQTAALDAQRAAIGVQTLRMQSAVALVRALGGDYSAASAS